MYMPLTYLNTKMVKPPVFTDIVATGIQAATLSSNVADVNVLSADQIYFPTTGGDIFNNARFFGNLTVNGSISALSGLNIISTTTTSTSALSVVNAGLGPAFFVNQSAAGLEKAISINASNTEIIQINNPSPTNTNVGVTVKYSGPGNVVSVLKTTDSSQTAFTITSSGNVGINTSTPTATLQVSGNIAATSFTGPLTGNVQGNLTGNVNGDVTSSTITTNTINSTNANITTLNITSLGVSQITAASVFGSTNVTDVLFNYEFTNNDIGKIFHFDTVSFPLTAYFPSTLNNGFNVTLMNISTNFLQLSGGNTLNAIGDKIYERFGSAFVYKHNGQFYAIGRLAN
jgi:hypothetical protein